MDCRSFEEGLATLAEGGENPEAAAHVAGCAACAARLSELTRVVRAARLEQAAAPSDLVARAKALMEPRRRRLAIRLLGNSLSAAGARSAKSDAFSVHLGAEELSVRLQYSPTADGWEVAGRAPAEGWTLVRDGQATGCGTAGRFRFEARDLESAAFTLRSADAEISVPPASELLDRAP